MSGYAEKADSFISSTIWGYSPVKGVGEYDPAKAAELLKQAGYPDGKGLPELNLYTSFGFYPKTKEYNEYISACLAAVGIKCTVVPMDTSAWGDILYDETPCHPRAQENHDPLQGRDRPHEEKGNTEERIPPGPHRPLGVGACCKRSVDLPDALEFVSRG